MTFLILCPRCSGSIDAVCEAPALGQAPQLREIHCPHDGCQAVFRPQLLQHVVAVRRAVPAYPAARRFEHAS